MLAKYDYITEDTLAYFKPRLHQAPRDAEVALAYVQRHADTAEKQQACVNALITKCDILWAMLDALQFAYVEPGGNIAHRVRSFRRTTETRHGCSRTTAYRYHR